MLYCNKQTFQKLFVADFNFICCGILGDFEKMIYQVDIASGNVLQKLPVDGEVVGRIKVYQNNIYTVIAASNIGAFLTPIGALAGIMWLSLLKKQKLKFSFVSFMEYGSIFAIPAILIVILMVTII